MLSVFMWIVCLCLVLLFAYKCVVTVDDFHVGFFFFKQKTAYEMRISDWSSDVCSSDLGQPTDQVWYFAFEANMHDSAFRDRRQMSPLEWRPGRVQGHRLRFNLEGRPKGSAAPANIAPDLEAEVWGVLYRIQRKDHLCLDSTAGWPARPSCPPWLGAEGQNG